MKFLTAYEFGRLIGIGGPAVRALIRKGHVQAEWHGNAYAISPRELRKGRGRPKRGPVKKK